MIHSKRSYLAWFDVLFLTLLLFGQAIYSSTELFLTNLQENSGPLEEVATQVGQDLIMLVFQGGLLLLALLYLKVRRFDFSQWNFRVTIRDTAKAFGFFLLFSALMDVLFWVLDPNYSAYFLQAKFDLKEGWAYLLSFVNLPKVAYALLNGAYEELYFLGMCLAVPAKHRPKYWLFSLMVRFAFHTYQGLLAASGISLILGIGYYLIYDRWQQDNLYPLILSHAIADVLGLNLLIYLFA